MLKKFYNGAELFCVDKQTESFSVRDFWHFAFGDLLDNTRRGTLAEFIVARALGLNTDIPREDWSAYDLDYNGTRIEVKASAYLQSWNLENGKISKPTFSIAPARVFDSQSGRCVGERCRNSDIYIFCCFTDTDAENYNILDLSRWDFYVALTSEIDRLFPTGKSLSLGNVSNIAEKTEYFLLKSIVDKLIGKRRR